MKFENLEVTFLRQFMTQSIQRIVLQTILCLLLSSVAAIAHHSVFAEYDIKRETQFRAKVTSVEWANPHASIHALVQDGSPETVWTFELPGPSGLVKVGWTPDTLHTNDIISVTAFRAKNGSAKASVHRMTLANGRSFELDHPFTYQPDYQPLVR
jgi:hypothetical protein